LISIGWATGRSSWTETAPVFEKGERSGTVIGTDGLLLQKTDRASENWTKISDGVPVGGACSLVYDSVNDLMVLISSDASETWTYSFSEDYWTRKNPSIMPDTLNMPAIAYNGAKGRVILFNGETWTYDTLNDTWSNMSPVVPPPVLSSAAMVYDTTTGLMTLFGGIGNGTILNETWAYDLATNSWTNMSPAISPPARCYHAMSYDSVRQKTVLFGGYRGFLDRSNKSLEDHLNDTWTYDYGRNVWTNMSPQNAPPGREMHGIVYDSHSDNVVLFGGKHFAIYHHPWLHEVALGDTWTYFLGGNSWTNMSKSDPGPRTLAGMTYDTVEQRVVLFGGYGGESTIWTYSPGFNRWWGKTSTNIPSPRSYFAMAYDRVFNEIVLFGGRTGYYSPFTFLNDTHIFNLSTNTWSNKKPSLSPPAQASQAMVYDSASGEMVLFGLGETWAYNVGSSSWTKKNPKEVPGIQPQAMAFDSKSGLTVLIGENGGNTETWTYNSTADAWTDMRPANSLNGMRDSAMAFDTDTGEMVVYGSVNYYGQTWTYNISQNNWTRRTTTPAPSAAGSVAMAYNAAEHQTVLFGGFHAMTGVFHETWTYNASNGTWTRLNTNATPSGRVGHRMVYDWAIGRIVIFGGEYNEGSYVRTETWAFDIRELSDSGIYTSAPFDTGGKAYFGTMQWTGLHPSGTSVKFQIRMAETSENLSASGFAGPDGTLSSFYERNGTTINGIHNGSRWMQYRAYLYGSSRASSPSIRSVTVMYNLLHNISLIAPLGGEEFTGIQHISWLAVDPDNDSLSFDIFLETGSVRIPLATDLANGTTSWSLNTDLYPNGTYRIRVVARDGNPSIPLIASAVSSNFRIFHPAPPAQNHPPEVALVWPPDKSCILEASVGLRWNGTDSDGDSLTYSVYLSEGLSLSGDDLRSVTMDNNFGLEGLRTNMTYYWTVDAWDGKTNCTGRPPPIWSFTVILPPGNVPVRITSVPPNSTRVGDEYIYCVTSIDEDGDIPAYSLLAGPSNMTIDIVTGKLSWLAGESDIGNHTITVLVTDNRGSIARQTYTLLVIPRPKPPLPVPVPPHCKIISPSNGSTVKGLMHVTGTAVNGTSPLRIIHFRIDSGNWMDALGLENWTQVVDTKELGAGRHRLEARAFDGLLYSETASVDFFIVKPEPNVSTKDNSWVLPAVLLIIISAMGIFLVIRMKKRD
jgi:hypothetical protein